MAYTYSKLASYTVGSGGIASVSFLAIPQNYTDLVVKFSARSTVANNSISLELNNSSSNFSNKHIYGAGSGAAASGSRTDFYESSVVNESGYTASVFGNSEIYFSNYAGSNYKSFSIDGVIENNATLSYITLIAGLWSNTQPITSMNIIATNGSFVQYSTFTIYGIKAEV